MRNMIIKMILFGLMLFVSKSPVLAQNTDIKCEVSGFDFSLVGKSGYLIEFGSFSLSEKGKQGEVIKHYKIPRTKLILNVLVYVSKDKPTLYNQLSMMMILGKKNFSPSSAFDEEKIAEDSVGLAQTLYPIDAFDKGGEGMLSTAFFGKKKPVGVIMRCKKEGK